MKYVWLSLLATVTLALDEQLKRVETLRAKINNLNLNLLSSDDAEEWNTDKFSSIKRTLDLLKSESVGEEENDLENYDTTIQVLEKEVDSLMNNLQNECVKLIKERKPSATLCIMVLNNENATAYIVAKTLSNDNLEVLLQVASFIPNEVVQWWMVKLMVPFVNITDIHHYVRLAAWCKILGRENAEASAKATMLADNVKSLLEAELTRGSGLFNSYTEFDDMSISWLCDLLYYIIRDLRQQNLPNAIDAIGTWNEKLAIRVYAEILAEMEKPKNFWQMLRFASNVKKLRWSDKQESIKKALPKSVHSILFADTVELHSGQSDPLVLTADELFDKYRRNVTLQTWNSGRKRKSTWKLEAVANTTDSFFIKSIEYNGYLFQSVLDYDQDRRRVFTWENGRRLDSGQFTFIPEGDNVRIRCNEDSEYLQSDEDGTVFTRRETDNTETTKWRVK